MKKRVRTCSSQCHHAKLPPGRCRCWCGGQFHGEQGAAARAWVAQMGAPALAKCGFKKGETAYKDQLELPIKVEA